MTPDPLPLPPSSPAAAEPAPPQPSATPADAAHVPAPVDLASQSVAGEEDPGASLDVETTPVTSDGGSPPGATQPSRSGI